MSKFKTCLGLNNENLSDETSEIYKNKFLQSYEAILIFSLRKGQTAISS